MADYKLDGAILKVEGHLDFQDDHLLYDNCKKMMEADGSVLTVDLSKVPYINSSCIGVLSATWVDVLTQERKMELIVSGQVRRALTLSGFHRVFNLKDPE